MHEEKLTKTLDDLESLLLKLADAALILLTVSLVVDKYQRFLTRFTFVGLLLRLLSTPKTSDAMIGDLEERYATLLQHQGRQVATLWFWRQVFYSSCSLALDALKRISGLEKLIDRYRRIG